MRITSFRTRMALLLLALFVVVLVPTFLAIHVAIRQSAVHQAEQRLEAGGRIIHHALDVRGEQLHQAVQVVASDFGFKQAVATGDEPTIRTALYNHGHRVHADLMVLTDMQGHVIASSGRDGQPVRVGSWADLVEQAGAQSGQYSAVRMIDGQPYQLVVVPVKAPRPIAWVGMGFALNSPLARSLSDITQLDLTFVHAGRPLDGGWSIAGSTLAPDLKGALLRHGSRSERGARQPVLQMLEGNEYMSLWYPLQDVRPSRVGVWLQYPLYQALAPFRALQRELAVIGLLCLLASVAGALLLARSVTRPLTRLSLAASRIGQGEYDVLTGVRRKDELGDLAVAFENMQRGIARRERKIAYQAYHDSLTSLPNREKLQQRLEEGIARARSHAESLAVLMLDIDGFKEINDTMGHAVGDQVLIEVGRRLRTVLRGSDTVARFGGDEFVLLLESVRDERVVHQVAGKAIKALSATVHVESLDLFLEVSIGAALCPEHGTLPEELLRRADIAMYDAKQTRSRLCIYTSGRDEKHLYRLSLIHDLRRAIHGDELQLHYQPKLDLRSGEVLHAEALLRWNHPKHGMIQPDEFIPLAEHSGSIRHLTQWVLREVARQCRAWHDAGLEIGVALNLSAMDLGSGDLPDTLAACLDEYGVPASRLVLEVTETAVMHDTKFSQEVLKRLKACGVQLTIDDFGTGYSSLSHLKRLPVDELKIDKSFVMEMARDSDDATIVRSTIELAHNMGLSVAAEGVEDEQAMDMLRDYRCDTAQGYLISHPLSAVELERWLHARQAAPVT